MDGLRLLLLLFGVLVIAGVYLYTRRQQRQPDDAPLPERKTPTIAAGGDEPVLDEPVLAEEDVDDAEELVPETEVAPKPQKIVTLRLVARDRGAFPGDALILSLRGIGMRHGKFGIFHRIDGDDEERTVFSAASLVEPGSFDLENIKDQQIPGISLFMVLPGPLDGAEAFDMMMEAARTLAQSLDGELLDETGSTLSIQRERYMREEIVQFEHSHKVA
ncbi:MAG: cell division protein ZipA [Woeseiaceae bacterium]|nr:cell division protein ZipA [Woeseiaceae bacterium]